MTASGRPGTEQLGAEQRIDAALQGMSFTQRVGQLNQRLLGWRAVERTARGFALTDEARREIDRWGGLGALYGLFRADAWSGRGWQNGIRPDERAEVAALVQAHVRSVGGVGVLLSEEAPHGHQALGGSILPAVLSMAATFDTDAVREASAAVAAELAASGVHLALVSTLDLLRDGRWGRGEECFGEDPFLASLMTTAVVEGMQGPARQTVGGAGVAVVLKHLAAQGEAMGGRNGQSSMIGPRDLEELHLPMVAAGVAAGALGFMAAYNDIDGIPCCANRALLHDTLRDRFAFDGLVMADGLAVDRLQAITGSASGAGRLALLSGVDLSLWDDGFATLDGAEDDPEVRSAVDVACRRVLAVKERFGLLGGTAPAPRGHLRESIRLGERASRHLADACLVLLDDGGTLPWSPDRLGDVLVVGAYADEHTAMLGDYVAPLEHAPATILGALQAALPAACVRGAHNEVDAAESARAADAVVVVVGGTSHRSYDDEFASNGALGAMSAATSGEGVDLADLELPSDQVALVRQMAEAAPGRVTAVVVAGRPHVLTPLVEAGVAIVWAGYPGPYGGQAVADALLGHRSPTGRLPFTSPRANGVGPVHHNDRHDAAGVYRDVPDAVLFAFGAGRGYREATLSQHRASAVPEGVEFSVHAHNPHPLAVDVVLAVYVRRSGDVALPRRRELAGIIRAELAAHEARELTVVLGDGSVRAQSAAAASRVRVMVGDWATDVDLLSLDVAVKP